MNSFEKTPEATHRRTRALVARTLIGLHEKNELESPEMWNWQCVDKLPIWCLLEIADRRQIQLMCGLLVNAPSIACWLDGRSIRAVHEQLGEEVVEQVLQQALALSDNEKNQHVLHTLEAYKNPPPESVETFLLESGGAVLRCSLDASLPIERLGSTLEGADLVIPDNLARTVLARAHDLLPGIINQLHTQSEEKRRTSNVSANSDEEL